MNKYQSYIDEITKKIAELNAAKVAYDQQLVVIKNARERLTELKKIFDEFVKTKSEGFPLLSEAYSEFLDLKYSQIESLLSYKRRPAIKAAEEVRNLKKELKVSARKSKELEYIVKYYEQMYPQLVEVRGEDKNMNDIAEEDNNLDPIFSWITVDEFKKLNITERNQLALDRWWSKWKDKKGIGLLYEMYIGYLFENNGYYVEYNGIKTTLEDLGRDLIAIKNNKILIVQCKYWSKSKVIHEKHIFQLFGTTFEYKLNNPQKDVKAVFCTSTKLSDKARKFTEVLDIEIRENLDMQRFPIIKCNVNKSNNTKIYHLPFDQQYYKTVIVKEEGDIMTDSVLEAENMGFRRAYKHISN